MAESSRRCIGTAGIAYFIQTPEPTYEELARIIGGHLLEIYKKRFGYEEAVATLKAERFAKIMLENLGLSKYFDAIHGVDEGDKLNKAALLEICMKELQVDCSECVLVGDSANDEQGAMAAGIGFIAVTYGFGYTKENVSDCRALFTADSPLEIVECMRSETVS